MAISKTEILESIYEIFISSEETIRCEVFLHSFTAAIFIREYFLNENGNLFIYELFPPFSAFLTILFSMFIISITESLESSLIFPKSN